MKTDVAGEYGQSGVAPYFVPASYALIVGAILWYSKILLLFTQPLASLGVSVIFGSLAAFFFVRPSFREVKFLFFSCATLYLLWVSILLFSYRAGLYGDWRTIGNFCAIFLVFPIVYLARMYSFERAVFHIYTICLIYASIYLFVALSVEYFDWFSSVEPRGIILQDPSRGRRVFACSTIIFFVLVLSLFKVIEQRKIFYILPFIVCVFSLYYSQSRTPTIVAVVVLSIIAMFRKGVAYNLGFFAVLSFFVFGVSSMLFMEYLQEILLFIDEDSMMLRILNLDVAYQNFQNYPLFGFGYPGDASFNEVVFGQIYYPEDLGSIGILATFGIVGAIWFLVSFNTALAGMKIVLQPKLPLEMAAVGYSGLFMLILNNFWPTMIFGDGGIVFSILYAAIFVRCGSLYTARKHLRPVN